MYKRKILAVYVMILTFSCYYAQENSWIRVNQLGYAENDIKTAVLISKENINIKGFSVVDALTDKEIFSSNDAQYFPKWGAFEASYRLNFTAFKIPGAYYIRAGEILSPVFRINNDVYDGTADFILNYMRQQRCGYNPFLRDSCHIRDGYIIYHPTLDSTYINVIGGWHDASDYLQYATTSANAVFQMLFAYYMNPISFLDQYDENGNIGSNKIPDIIDEAKWGLDWLVRMNPDSGKMFNQIADDRDHAGFRLPNHDTVSYGRGNERPVYFCTGEPQGIFNYKNRTDGIASTAGKFSSSFLFGSLVMKDFYPEFSNMIYQKGVKAYEYGKLNPGVCQTAPCKAPYFYEEDNWMDDMQLAAIQAYLLTLNQNYLRDAINYGEMEIFTPWMGAKRANHYQWYPFINLGHYFVAKHSDSATQKNFQNFMKEGLQKIYEKAQNNPFLIGIPFVWCSNNLVVAAITQANLYFLSTNDSTYLKMEASLRDWLFGCNPWGISMVIGLPEGGNYPKDPHSSLHILKNYKINGGLVDGPVYEYIFKNQKWITIHGGDEYFEFQSEECVYHDDYGDYATNEPTMDGTASLSYYLSAKQKDAGFESRINHFIDKGAITRFDKNQKVIYLTFTGHEFADGSEIIIKTLESNNAKANFFFTGDFYRNPDYKNTIEKLIEHGHYLGAHSDKHLLYCDWENRDSTLISKESFLNDIKNNYCAMEKFGIAREEALYFLPPYEWYNEEIASWTKAAGLKLINFSPGTYSNSDYTTPDMKNRYLSGKEIFNKIINYEETQKNGLNGFILLTHIGTHPSRTDKFYHLLDELIKKLKEKGYSFKTLKKN